MVNELTDSLDLESEEENSLVSSVSMSSDDEVAKEPTQANAGGQNSSSSLRDSVSEESKNGNDE